MAQYKPLMYMYTPIYVYRCRWVRVRVCVYMTIPRGGRERQSKYGKNVKDAAARWWGGGLC